jgi:D-alanine-D-alanine ligase
MQKLRVAVLRGGPSSEYEVSLKTGASALSHFRTKYDVSDVLIDKEGVWHMEGIPVTPDELARKVDVVFNALHGKYGEDGKVQRILEMHNVPYTGSNSFSSAIGMNKVLSKNIFLQQGIKTPLHLVLKQEDANEDRLHEVFRTFPLPAILKPVNGGSSIGVVIVKSFADLAKGVEEVLKYDEQAMLEEMIIGKEATCGIVNDFRGEKHYSLLPIEIRKPEGKDVFDYEDKYGTESGNIEICPGNFTPDEKKQLQELSQKIHEALGLRQYSRSDFIIHPKRGIYALEVNTLPGLTAASLVPKSLAAVGCTLPEFLDHLVTQAHQNK